MAPKAKAGVSPKAKARTVSMSPAPKPRVRSTSLSPRRVSLSPPTLTEGSPAAKAKARMSSSSPVPVPTAKAKARAAAKSAPPCVVPSCTPLECYLYLAPGSSNLIPCKVKSVPSVPDRCVRVVCISDTHNEHEGLRLPAGDVLIHTGDVLTESGMRHVVREPNAGTILSVKPQGEALLNSFAVWFGSQHFAHKALVAGNHDLVLQGLGKQRVQDILTNNCAHGNVVYLEDEEATLGNLRVYGSPHADYGGHNDAFRVQNPTYKIQSGVHVVATHMPGVLPSRYKGQVDQHEEMVRPMLEAGALLHVSGHCHWANGLYFAEGATTRIPCVVASVCDSTWLHFSKMASATGYRGDPLDKRYGGYNLVQPGIICDLLLPETREIGSDAPGGYPVKSKTASMEASAAVLGNVIGDDGSVVRRRGRRTRSTIPARHGRGTGDKHDEDSANLKKVSLLFFCPPNDPELPHVLIPLLDPLFDILHVQSVNDGIQAISERRIGACVAKLGTAGNLGRDVIAALRSVQGSSPFVVIHSATAAQDERTRAALDDEFGIGLFTEHGFEADLVEALRPSAHTIRVQSEGAIENCLSASASDWLYGVGTDATPPTVLGGTTLIIPRVLLFAPSLASDGFADFLLPQLQSFCDVDVVETSEDGIQAVRDKTYKACIAKLGTAGNLGVDVIAAFRGEFGDAPFVAVHSATAASKPALQKQLKSELGVSLFVQHGEEAELVTEVSRALTRTL